MNNTDRQAHWQNVYATAEKEVSWFQENPAPSLDLIAATGIQNGADIIDVGGAPISASSGVGSSHTLLPCLGTVVRLKMVRTLKKGPGRSASIPIRWFAVGTV